MTRIYKRRREDALPTPRTALRARFVRVVVFCNSCRHQADGSDRTDFVVTSRDNPQPW
jgi:hypothetical protein